MKKTYKLIERNNDIVLGNQDLEPLYTFKQFPVFAGCVNQNIEDDILEDLQIWISKSSGMIQINPILPADIVYQDEHGSGTIGQSWLNHHRAFAKFLEKQDPKNIFEIAGGHGILSKYYLDSKPDVLWTIIEPNPIPYDNPKIKVIKDFFKDISQIDDDVDMIVHSHFFEHIFDPVQFVKSISTLKLNTKMCFSVPALKIHLEKKFTSILNFEHTYLCTEEFIEWVFKCQGFTLLDKMVYDTDHSIFYAFEKNENITESITYLNEYTLYKNLFNEYIKYNVDLINDINDQIKNIDNPVFLFGGHFFSQFLISFGLNVSKLSCIIDNSKLKEHKRLYGTNLIVKNPRILKDLSSPVVILRAGVFNEEIKRDILTNINPTTKFLESI